MSYFYDYLNYVMCLVAIVGYGACVFALVSRVSPRDEVVTSELDLELAEWSTLDTVEEIVSSDLDYEGMTVKELKQLCKMHGIKGYSRLRKSELVTVLKVNVSVA
jgi:Rho termination factor, N-terminal domain